MKKAICGLLFSLAATVAAQPNISAVYVQSSTSTTATIVWTTNVGATSQVKYGTTSSLQYATNVNYNLVTSHSVTITFLNASQPYYFAVVSTASGQSAQSSTYQFALCGSPLVPVTATINQFYYSGTYSLTWNAPSGAVGSPTICGQSLTTPINGTMTLAGSFSTQVADALKVTPGPGTWTVHATDIGNLSPISVTLALTASTQDISAQLQAAASTAGLVGVIANTNNDMFWPPISASTTSEIATTLNSSNVSLVPVFVGNAATSLGQAPQVSSGITYNPSTGILTSIVNLANGSTAITQANTDTSTKAANDAFVWSVVGGSTPGPYLPLVGGTLTGALNGTSAAFSGTVAAQLMVSDVERTNAHWFDVRSKGVTFNGVTDDTAAWSTNVIPNLAISYAELPPGISLITPGPSTGTSAMQIPYSQEYFKLAGRGPDGGGVAYETALQASSTYSSSAPMLQCGDGSAIAAGCDLEGFTLRGASGVSFPYGELNFKSENLSEIHNVNVYQYGSISNSIGIFCDNSGATQEFGEMRFYTLGVYGPNPSIFGTTGISCASPGSNTDLFSPSIEHWGTGVNFTSYSGTPVLNVFGGHDEGIPSGGFAFYIDQATINLIGTNMESGTIYLGSSAVNSEIEPSNQSKGWPRIYVDNGIGNKYRTASPSVNKSETLNLRGDEWAKVAGNVVPDPFFLENGATGWTATNATVAVSTMTAPGLAAGQSLLITPSASGGYIQQCFAVASSTDYRFLSVHYFNQSQTEAQVQVYDQTGTNLLWDSGAFSGATATPSGPDSYAYRAMRQWIPSGSATQFCVRIISPNDTPVQFLGLTITPSIMTMSSVTLAGTASCSGSGVAYSCQTPGENNGASTNSVTWNITAPTYNTGGFVRFHAVTASTSVSPECVFNGRNFYLMPGTSLDYNIPVSMIPSVIYCEDYAGPTTANDVVISQVSVTPWYQQNVAPIIVYNDGNFVEGITPDGVQQRGPVPGSTGWFPKQVAKVPSTCVTGNSTITGALTMTTAVAGDYEVKVHFQVYTAGTAGSVTPQVQYTTLGTAETHNGASTAVTSPIDTSWIGLPFFWADASTSIALNLSYSSVTGSPRVCYDAVINQLQ